MSKCDINLRKICIYIYLFSYKRYFIIFRYLNNLCNLKKKMLLFSISIINFQTMLT